MLSKKQEEFSVLKEYIKRLLSQNEKLKKENDALKRVIENFHANQNKDK